MLLTRAPDSVFLRCVFEFKTGGATDTKLQTEPTEPTELHRAPWGAHGAPYG